MLNFPDAYRDQHLACRHELKLIAGTARQLLTGGAFGYAYL